MNKKWLKKIQFKKGHIPWHKGLKIQTNTGRTHFKKGEHGSLKTEFKKGQISYNKGKKFSKELRKKMSLVKIGKNTGKDNWNWKGGITSLRGQIYSHFKTRQWRSDVFARDDFTCQECRQKGGNLEIHHIKPFNIIIKENRIKTIEQALNCEELWNINNGQTLCLKCHNKTKKKSYRE